MAAAFAHTSQPLAMLYVPAGKWRGRQGRCSALDIRISMR
jgi:hypothetical protein